MGRQKWVAKVPLRGSPENCTLHKHEYFHPLKLEKLWVSSGKLKNG